MARQVLPFDAILQLGGSGLDSVGLLRQSGLGLVPGLLDLLATFGEQAVGLRLRFGQHLCRDFVDAVEDPCCLGSECRRQRRLIEHRMAGPVLRIGQLVE